MRFTLKQIQSSTAKIVSITTVKPGAALVVGPTGRITRSGSPPHDLLWLAIERRWPGAARRELERAVPQRRFRIDIGFPSQKLALEVDGWQWHGKHKQDFVRDRERQNLLCVHGWRILRFSAGMIYQQLPEQLEHVALALATGPAPILPDRVN